MAPFLLRHAGLHRVASFLIGALFLVHAAIFGPYIADDAGISLAYGRNLASGNGLVLHPGGEAVEGYSNPLWTVLLATGAALRLDGSDGVPLLKTLGILLGLAALGLTLVAGKRAYPADTNQWIAPALLAALTPFVFWTTSGLENGLYAFLMVLAVVLQLGELGDPNRRPWSAVALGGLALTRPEGIAFVIPFVVHRLLSSEPRQRLVVWILVVVGIYAAFIASRVAIFGDWLPNTYYAKVTIYQRALSRLPVYLVTPGDRGMRYVVDAVRASWPLLALAALGLCVRRDWRFSLLVGGVVIGTALYAVYVAGDFWPAGRFFTAVLPLIALAVQHALNQLRPAGRRAIVVAAAIVVGVVLNRGIVASGELRVLEQGDALISLQGRLREAHRLQAFFTAVGVSDPLVLDPDIGGPSVAGLQVLDLGGLTDRAIGRKHYDPAFFRSYVFEQRRPHVIRTHSTWTSSSRVTTYPEFARDYVAVRSRQNALGLHGEFVRRDLVNAGGR